MERLDVFSHSYQLQWSSCGEGKTATLSAAHDLPQVKIMHGSSSQQISNYEFPLCWFWLAGIPTCPTLLRLSHIVTCLPINSTVSCPTYVFTRLAVFTITKLFFVLAQLIFEKYARLLKSAGRHRFIVDW